MLSFKVFGKMISLIYNPILKGISYASTMARFWRERVWRESKRKKEKKKRSGIHTLNL
jgi:hypothetical protein